MHEIIEEVTLYDMALIVTHRIKDKYYTFFRFLRKKNSPPAIINQSILNNGCTI